MRQGFLAIAFASRALLLASYLAWLADYYRLAFQVCARSLALTLECIFCGRCEAARCGKVALGCALNVAERSRIIAQLLPCVFRHSISFVLISFLDRARRTNRVRRCTDVALD